MKRVAVVCAAALWNVDRKQLTLSVRHPRFRQSSDFKSKHFPQANIGQPLHLYAKLVNQTFNKQAFRLSRVACQQATAGLNFENSRTKSRTRGHAWPTYGTKRH